MIEKSTDAVNYEMVDELPSAGNSQLIIDYDYIDDNVYDGLSYYRLKQTDFDGKFEYFPPKSISINSELGRLKIKTIKPNPFSNQFTLEIQSKKEGIADFIIANIKGVRTYTSQIQLNEGFTEHTFNEGNLSPSETYCSSYSRGERSYL